MLGWNIDVFRQENGGPSPATFGTRAPRNLRIAVWQTGLGGLAWLTELVRNGNAIDLGGNGYPCRYTAMAEHIAPRLLEGPPLANAVWGCDPGDILLEGWEGKTVVDREAIEACRPDEWLLVEAWDES